MIRLHFVAGLIAVLGWSAANAHTSGAHPSTETGANAAKGAAAPSRVVASRPPVTAQQYGSCSGGACSLNRSSGTAYTGEIAGSGCCSGQCDCPVGQCRCSDGACNSDPVLGPRPQPGNSGRRSQSGRYHPAGPALPGVISPRWWLEGIGLAPRRSPAWSNRVPRRPSVSPTAQRRPVTIRWSGDLRKAARRANASRKPMLVKIGADWCGYCKRMARETFVDSRIVRHVNECFIPVTLDAERNADLARRMGAEALPTTVIVTPDTRIVQRITGFRTAEQLGSDLTRYCGAEKRHRGASDLRTHDFGRRQPVRNRNDRFSLLPADVRALTISVSQMR